MDTRGTERESNMPLRVGAMKISLIRNVRVDARSMDDQVHVHAGRLAVCARSPSASLHLLSRLTVHLVRVVRPGL